MNHRFFLQPPLLAGAAHALTGDELHHARVVRVREGEEVEVFDGTGSAFRARYTEGTVLLIEPIGSRESAVHLHVAMAIIQLEKFELVLQKATELGARSFFPMVTERVELRPERYRGKAERWNRIVFEAVKQSGRSTIPRVHPPTPFAEIAVEAGTRILFDADADPVPVSAPVASATLLIGPEGGWSDAELIAARQAGCSIERLGDRRLRAETAAIVATALIAARCGELSPC